MNSQKDYRTNSFFEEVRQRISPKENLLNCPLDQLDGFREKKKAELGKILQIDQLKQDFMTELVFSKEEEFEALGEQVEKYKLDGIKGLAFPLYKICPKNPNGKGILYLHGHDPSGVHGAFVTRPDKEPYHKNIAIKMARRGYTVYLPELIGYGEAVYTYRLQEEEEKSECFLNSGYLAMTGYNIAGFRTFQSLLVLEIMKKEGFGVQSLFGVSGGGLIGMFVGVLGKDIDKIMLSSFTNTWVHSALGKEHCVDNYIPGIMRVGESYEILSLAAPKAMLTINGTGDRPFPKAGSLIAFDFLEKVYERLKVRDRLTTVLFEGRHEVNAQEVLSWLDAQG